MNENTENKEDDIFSDTDIEEGEDIIETNQVIIPSQEQQEQQEQQSNILINNNNMLSNMKIKLIKMRKEIREKEKEKEEENRKNKKRKKIKRDIKYVTNYIKLITGEELHFKEEDNNKYPLLLPNWYLSDELIRNIVRRIPQQVNKRIQYLGKFQLPIIAMDPSYGYYETIRNIVYETYYKEFKLRWKFRALLQRWRIYKMDKLYVYNPDPITLCDPEKPIIIYDRKAKKKFVFDAKSLANSINSNLLYYENGFAIPQFPKNLITNTPFLYIELISIYYQLQQAGEAKWALSTLKSFNFNKVRWEFYNKSILFYKAIQNEIKKLDTFDGRELFLDFVISKLEEYNLHPTNYVIKAYERGLIYLSNHFYIQSLKPIVLLHYEAEHFKVNKEQTIKTLFMRLYKHQSKFIKEMVQKGFL